MLQRKWGKWAKVISPILITALVLTSLVIFPTAASALTASLERVGVGLLGPDTYLLGEWIDFYGEVTLTEGEVADITGVTFVADGPEAVTRILPLEEGIHEYRVPPSNPEVNLIVIVTWINVVGSGTGSGYGYGYGYDYNFVGGTGGGRITYEIMYRPPYMLTDPPAELPDSDLAWEVPDVTGLTAGKKPQGLATDGTNLWLLVDGTTNDKIIKADRNGTVLDSFDAPNKQGRAITYLNGHLYVSVDNYEQVFSVTGETPNEMMEQYCLNLCPGMGPCREIVDGSLVVTADGEIVPIIQDNFNQSCFEIDESGIWDRDVVRAPTVVKVGSTYHMWYYSDAGTGGNEQIGHATSTNRLDWNKDAGNPVLGPGPAGDWDESGTLHPSAWHDGSTFHMWYIGYDSSDVRQVGYATSPDGSTWTKSGSNPVMGPGAAGAWDTNIRDMDVINNPGTWKMWYTATGSSDTPRIGYASSTDGVNWTKLEANPQNLTGSGGSSQPSYSPDGSQIVYAVSLGNLWTINSDGTGDSFFYSDAGTIKDPAWHPTNSDLIAYSSNATGNYEIYILDTSTSPVTTTQVTFRPDDGMGNLIHDIEPTWSPAGNKLIYASSDAMGSYELRMINSDGSSDMHIYNGMSSCRQPAWHPGGQWLAWSEGGDIKVGKPKVGWMDNQENLTSNFAADDTQPAWSPGGNRLAFNRDGNLWTNPFDPSDAYSSRDQETQLTDNANNDTWPAWSPTIDQIAFASDRAGGNDIWVSNTILNPVLSPSGDQWSWDGNGLYSPTVAKVDSTYHIWYAATGGGGMGGAQIGHATSSDGLDWNPAGSNPILSSQCGMDDWQCGGVDDPDAISGSLYLWYTGLPGMGNGAAIGYAGLSVSGNSFSPRSSNPVLEGGMGDAEILASYSYTEGDARNSIVQMNPADGSVENVWDTPSDGMGWSPQIGGLTNDGTHLYGCTTNDDRVYQIDPNDGSKLEEKWFGGWGYWGANALAYRDGMLYAGDGGLINVLDWDSQNVDDQYGTDRSGINALVFMPVGGVDILYIGAQNVGRIYTSALPGTTEKSSIGDYDVWLEVQYDGATTQTDPVAYTLQKLDGPVDVEITDPGDGDAFDTPQITIEGTVNDPSIDTVQVGIALPETTLLDDDMESGNSINGQGEFKKQDVAGSNPWIPYSPDNLWHITDQRSHSDTHSWGYNHANPGGYNTPGKANAGVIVSDSFNVGDDCVLSFWTSWDTDSWPEYDQKLVDIYVDGSWQPLAYIVDGDWYPDFFGGTRQMLVVPMAWMWKGDGGFGPMQDWNWYECTIDLSAYSGQNDVRIRFHFDTVDDWMNDFEGWYVDDVTVTGAGLAGIIVDVVDLGFSTTYTLAEGHNEITASGQSGYITGPDGSDSDTVTVSLDTTGPIVTLDPPTSYSTNSGSLEVSGTVYDLNFDNLVVTINDKPFYSLGDKPAGAGDEWEFSTQVPLFEGENVILAIATDKAGLTGDDTYTVIRDSTPPTIDVLSTIYVLGEVSARMTDLLIFQVNAVDLAPVGTDYEPSGVSEVLLLQPGGGGGDGDPFIPANGLPEAITDQWGSTGDYLMPLNIPDDAPPGAYSLTVQVYDHAGNHATETVTALVVSTLSAYNIYLMPEWNFISLPLIPDDDDPATQNDNNIVTLLAGVPGVESVWYYSANPGWSVYTPGAGPDGLTTMDPGKGYWVLMDEAAFDYSAPLAPGLPETPAPIKFSYEGQVLKPATVPPTYSVVSGWNSVGLHSEWSKPVTTYLRPVSVPQQVWAALLQYDNYIDFELGMDGGEPETEIFLGSFRTLLDTDSMNPGDGFWLYLVEDGNLVAMP
ncbi:hypothetical protein ACFLXE_00555 [Chloroflexota bacterium]